MQLAHLLTHSEAAEVALNRAQQLKMHDLENNLMGYEGTFVLRYVKRISPRNGGQIYFVVIELYEGCADSGEAIGVISPAGTFIPATDTELLAQQQLHI
jgi:hypothetical protein